MAVSIWPGCFAGNCVGRARHIIGRAFLYGLGANGQAGVTQALDIIHKELDLTMGLCGQSELCKVDSSILS